MDETKSVKTTETKADELTAAAPSETKAVEVTASDVQVNVSGPAPVKPKMVPPVIKRPAAATVGGAVPLPTKAADVLPPVDSPKPESATVATIADAAIASAAANIPPPVAVLDSVSAVAAPDEPDPFDVPDSSDQLMVTLELSQLELLAVLSLARGKPLSPNGQMWLRSFEMAVLSWLEREIPAINSGLKALRQSRDPVDAEKLPKYEEMAARLNQVHDLFGFGVPAAPKS